jgi:uncharacterized metal-binding protein YceD (DUF177 family)
MTPEFSRTLPVAQIGANEITRSIEATPEECAAVAHRLGLPELVSLAVTFRITRQDRNTFEAHGKLHARAVRSCVVSLDDFTEATDIAFTLRFVDREPSEEDMLEAPFDYDDGPDEVVYADGLLDLGEAAVEEYALALPAYPRKPGVAFEETIEAEPNPFAVLKKLSRPN